MSLLSILSQRRKSALGQLKTDSIDSNYIGSTMRAIPNQLSMLSINNDRIDLSDRPFELSFGNNLFTYSNDFSNDVWDKSESILITPNFDGGHRLQYDGSGPNALFRQSINPLHGETYNISFYVKSNTLVTGSVRLQSSLRSIGHSEDITSDINSNLGEFVRVNMNSTADINTSAYIGLMIDAGSTYDLVIKDFQISRSNTVQPYVETINEAARGPYLEFNVNLTNDTVYGQASIMNDYSVFGARIIIVDTGFNVASPSLVNNNPSGFSNNINEFTTWRVQMVGDVLEIIKNNTEVKTKQFVGIAPTFNNIGNSAGNGGFSGIFQYIDINGKILNFNETGNTNILNFTRKIPGDGIISTISSNYNYVFDVMRNTYGQLQFYNATEDTLTLNNPFELSFGNNLLKHSNDLTQLSSWHVNSTKIITPDYTTDPLGNQSAIRVQNMGQFNAGIRQKINVKSGNIYNFSVWIKKNTNVSLNNVDVRLQGFSGLDGTSLIGEKITQDWQRFDVQVTATDEGLGTFQLRSDVACDISIFGFQLSRSSQLLPYHETTTEPSRGPYLNLHFKANSLTVGTSTLLGNSSTNNSRLSIGANTNMHIYSDDGVTFDDISSTEINHNKDLNIRLQMVGDFYEMIVNDVVSSLVQSTLSSIPVFDTTSGNQPIEGFSGIYYSMNFNGKRLNFYERGNKPTVYFANEVNYAGLIVTNNTNAQYISNEMRNVPGELSFKNTSDDSIILKNRFNLSFGNNLLKHSNDFSNDVWTPSGSILITPNYENGPLPNTNATRYVNIGTSNGKLSQTIKFKIGSTYCRSIWIKLNSGTITNANVFISYGSGAFNNTSNNHYLIGDELSNNIGNWIRFYFFSTPDANNESEVRIRTSAACDLSIYGDQVSRSNELLPYAETTDEPSIGSYLEWMFSTNTGYDNARSCFLSSTDNSGTTQQRLNIATDNLRLIPKTGDQTSFEITPQPAKTPTKYKLQAIGDSYKLFINDVLIDTKQSIKDSLTFNTIGSNSIKGIDSGLDGILYYMDFNGDVLSFNEQGSHPYTYFGDEINIDNVNDFVIEVTTTTPNENFVVGLAPNKSYDFRYKVDDNNWITHTSSSLTIQIPDVGTHQIRMYPLSYNGLPAFGYQNNLSEGNKITDIIQWGNNPWLDNGMRFMFAGARFTSISATDIPNLTQATSLEFMFQDCDIWYEGGKFESWDVKQIIKFNGLFSGCSLINPSVTEWDTGNADDISFMFNGTNSFIGDISGFNFSNVIYCQYAFNYTKFNSSVSNWNLSPTGTAQGLFFSSTALNQDLSAIDISSCPDVQWFASNNSMSIENLNATYIGWDSFPSYQYSLNNIDFGSSTYNSLARTAKQSLEQKGLSFYDGGEDNINTVDFVTTWETTTTNEDLIQPLVTGETYNFEYQVDGGEWILNTDDSLTINIPNIGLHEIRYKPLSENGIPAYRFEGMGDKDKIIKINQWGYNLWGNGLFNGFKNCNSLVSVDAVDYPKGLTSMRIMFDNCISLNSIDVSNWDVSKVRDMSFCFRECSSLVSLDVSNWDVSKVTDMRASFLRCSSLVSLDVSNWDVSKVRDMSFCFREIPAQLDTSIWVTDSLIQLNDSFYANQYNVDVSNFNTSNVTTFRSMFKNSPNANPDVSNWDTSSVTDINGMFVNCPNANPDVSNWDISNVTDMGNMFNSASSANPDVSNWDVSSVKLINGIFINASLANPDVSNWDISNATSIQSIFENASSANPDVSNWNVSNVTNMSYAFKNALSANPDVSNWNVSNVTNMNSMFTNTNLSIENYNKLLNIDIGWPSRPVQPGVIFSAGNAQYTIDGNAEIGRNLLTNDTNNWLITDGGEDNTHAYYGDSNNAIYGNDNYQEYGDDVSFYEDDDNITYIDENNNNYAEDNYAEDIDDVSFYEDDDNITYIDKNNNNYAD